MVLSRERGGEGYLDDIINQHCSLGTESQLGKLAIKSLVDIPLRTVVYTIGGVEGARASHLNARSHMLHALQCMEPTVLNWCEGILACLKSQLNKCKRGTLKQFGYGAVVVSFILSWVHHMKT